MSTYVSVDSPMLTHLRQFINVDLHQCQPTSMLTYIDVDLHQC